MKYAAFQVLKHAGAEGATADEIIKQATEKNFRSEWGERSRRTLLASLNQDKVFARTGMGKYALSALTGGLDLRVRRKSQLTENGENIGRSGCHHMSQGPPVGKAPKEGRAQESDPGVSGPAGTCSSSGTGAPEAPDPIALATQAEAQKAAALERAKAQLEQLKDKLKGVQRKIRGKELQIDYLTKMKDQPGAQGDKVKNVRIKTKGELRKGLKADEKAAQAVQEQIQEAKKQVLAATKAAAEAARNTKREQTKVEREAQRARRKQEALDAKRYPIDDLVLLKELQDKAKLWGEPAVLQDVHRPVAFSDVSSETTSRMLYVSDFLSEFGARLHLRPMHFTELEATLNGCAVGAMGAAKNSTDGGASLGVVYENLLQHILDDLTEEGLGDRHERRLCYVNGPGTWPEVLRRFTLRSADKPDSPVPEHTAAAAACLGSLSFNELETLQHLELLEFLCDEVLNTEKIRDTMQQRMDEIDDVSREMRVNVGEEKRKLRELLDAEKEERKRKREQEAAAKRAAEGQTAPEDAAGASDEGAAPEGKKAKTADHDTDSEEPCFDLPEGIREFKGDPTDRKALIAFRQQQQAEKRRLEKKRQRWETERHQLKKAKEATLRYVLAEQQRKARQKADAEGAVTKTQEAYEKVLDKYVIRRAPLGLDRHHRKYWWSLGGQKPVLYVEDGLGRWGSYSAVEELEKLMASLDTRGIREVELHRALEKTLPRMAKAMKRAICEQNRAVSIAERPPSREQPRREARKGMQGNCNATTDSHAGTPVQVEAAAINVSIQALKQIADLACSCKLKGPAGRWKAWREGVDAVSSTGPDQPQAKGELRIHALQLEEALISGTEEEKCYYDMEEEDDDEGGDEGGDNCDRHSTSSNDSAQEAGAGGIDGSAVASDSGSDLEGQCHGSSMRRATEVEEYLESDEEDGAPAWCVWRGVRERKSWRLDTSSAATISHVAYCILALSETAVPALEKYKQRKKL